MGHMHMKIQGLRSTRDKPVDTDLEYKREKNVVVCITLDPNTKNEGKFTMVYADTSPSHQSEEINTSTSCMYMVVMPY